MTSLSNDPQVISVSSHTYNFSPYKPQSEPSQIRESQDCGIYPQFEPSLISEVLNKILTASEMSEISEFQDLVQFISSNDPNLSPPSPLNDDIEISSDSMDSDTLSFYQAYLHPENEQVDQIREATVLLDNSDNIILVSTVEPSQQLCIPIHTPRDQTKGCAITEIED